MSNELDNVLIIVKLFVYNFYNKQKIQYIEE